MAVRRVSEDLDIRSGGAVAVDTETLRAAAGGFTDLAGELAEIAEIVGSAALRLLDTAAEPFGVSATVETARLRILSAVDEAGAIAASLRAAAAVYEAVELRAERSAAAAAGNGGALARIDSRLAALAGAYPDVEGEATRAAIAHWLRWPDHLAAQAPGVLWWAAPGMHTLAVPMAWAAQRSVGTLGRGTVPATARLGGIPKDVVVRPVPAHGPRTGATSLADAAARIPGGGSARIRVERYAMPDGSRQFALYVAGTQTTTPRTRDPFDMRSNIELYSGDRSASYDATLAALSDAGAEPGDVVHAFGHSQGAMVTAHLALEGGYDTRTLVSFGSPVEADVGAATLSVSLRHGDDPIAAFAGGGHPGAVGAPGSFIAERIADPEPGLRDLRLPGHGIDEYTHTARLLDDSDDARMSAVHRVFDELGTAASVEVTEYAAERVMSEPQPRPGPAPVTPFGADAG